MEKNLHMGIDAVLLPPVGGRSGGGLNYPFGMEIPVSGNSDNQLKYNGKELQMEAKLEWYDYGARFYDPAIGRWHVVDPLAEKYYSFTPHAYVGNNPIIYVDPDGRDRKLIYNQSTKTITVKATYYHDIGSTTTAMAGVKVFNEMKGMTYTDKVGATWAVKFELTTARSSKPLIAAAEDPQGNSFTVRGNVTNQKDGKEVAGIAINQKHIEVGVEFRDELTPAHEIGHTLGMALPNDDGTDNHSETGIMTPYNTHPNRNKRLEQINIDHMIEQGRGPVEQKRSFLDSITRFLRL